MVVGLPTDYQGVCVMRKLGIVLVLLGVELAREWFVLRCMGFEPGRFVRWVRSDDIGAR